MQTSKHKKRVKRNIRQPHRKHSQSRTKKVNAPATAVRNTVDSSTLSITPAHLLYLMATLFIVLVGINLTSINNYYQQTYHTDSPVEVATNWFKESFFKAEPTPDTPPTSGESSSTADPASSPDLVKSNNEPIIQPTEIKNALPTLQKLSNQEMGYLLTPNAKVLFVGDSLMQGVAPIVANQLKKNYQISSIDLSKQSTGLAYPKFFNWPQVVEKTLAEELDIRLIVVMLGANDPWDMPSSQKGYLKFKSEAWRKEYLERIEKIYNVASQHHVGIIWMDAPSMRKEDLNAGVHYLNELYKEAATTFNAVYLIANQVFSYQEQAFSPFTTIDDKQVKIRTNDGIHFTYAGQKLLAEAILRRIELTIPESTVPTLPVAPAESAPNEIPKN